MIATSIGIGLAVAFVLSRAVASLLYGINATDPGTFVLMAAILAAVALMGCYIPARRATTVNPLVALKAE
jgi:putative ABC transport system permease protein